jgi:hypothetical protein
MVLFYVVFSFRKKPHYEPACRQAGAAHANKKFFIIRLRIV